MRYTRPQSSYHERQASSAEAVKARRIHQVDYKDMDAAKGTIRAVGLGMLAWFLLIAAIVGVMAVIK